MKISFHTSLGTRELTTNVGVHGLNSSMPIELAKDLLDTSIGFGTAAINIIESLERAGFEVVWDSPAPVAIAWNHPPNWQFPPGTYRIGYTPWESSTIPESWFHYINQVDEIWVPSDQVAKWLKVAGIEKPITVYPHGIDPIWTPKTRTLGPDRVLRFLHVGEPAPRKGGEMALSAFRRAFGNRSDVHLTIKANKYSDIRIYADNGYILGNPADVYDNVTVITDSLSLTELVSLHHQHHVLLYPSYGEGFGFIPLQAMATGMPTVTTYDWAPYTQFMLPSLMLGAYVTDSPWPHIHPGEVYKPDLEELYEILSWLNNRTNFDAVAKDSMQQAFKIHDTYSWDELTNNVFKKIREKFS